MIPGRVGDHLAQVRMEEEKGERKMGSFIPVIQIIKLKQEEEGEEERHPDEERARG